VTVPHWIVMQAPSRTYRLSGRQDVSANIPSSQEGTMPLHPRSGLEGTAGLGG
jgi:hypothetical protein